MAAAPKTKGPRDPFEDLEDDKVTSKEKDSKKSSPKEKEETKEEMSPEDILDQDEVVEVDEKDNKVEEEFDDLDKDDQPEDKNKKVDQPKRTFIAQDDGKDNDLDNEKTATFDKLEGNEHNLDDLATEDINEKHDGGFGSYAKLGRKTMDLEDDQHVNSLGSQMPNSGIYSKGKNNAGGNKLHVVILVVIGLVVIGATIYLLKGNFTFPSSITQSTPAPSSTPEPSVQPSATPTPIDRSKFKIRVLNGTSTSGLAASEAAKLKDLGYQIDKTGNATSSAFTQTQVRAKSGLDDLIKQLISDLSRDYNGASSSALKASDTVDGEVILGK